MNANIGEVKIECNDVDEVVWINDKYMVIINEKENERMFIDIPVLINLIKDNREKCMIMNIIGIKANDRS